MSALYVINLEDFENDKTLESFKEPSEVTKEVGATILDVYSKALESNVDMSGVSRVVVNPEGNILFIKSDDEELDLLSYLNAKWSLGSVNCASARYIFPERMSVGVFDYCESTNDMDDESATELIDDNDDLLLGRDKYLVYMKDEVRLPFTESGTVIGRSSSQSDFVIHGNGSITKAHCKIYLEDGKAMIQDLNSSNGTYINGKRMPKGSSHVLHPDDEVVLSHGNGEVFVVEL